MAAIIYVLWDLGFGFDAVFSFLGREKVVGATHGTLWEWCVSDSISLVELLKSTGAIPWLELCCSGNWTCLCRYFRTSLDKYSAVMGMIFACNYPLTQQWFDKAAKAWKSLPLWLVGTALAGIACWWLMDVYSLPKVRNCDLLLDGKGLLSLLLFLKPIHDRCHNTHAHFLH